jgi:hypothetical protein
MSVHQFHQTYTEGLKAHIDSNTEGEEDINTPLSPDKKSTKKS